MPLAFRVVKCYFPEVIPRGRQYLGVRDYAGAHCAVVRRNLQVVEACEQGNTQVISDVQRIMGKDADYIPKTPQEIASHIFYTCYMGMAKNSSEDTRNRALNLSAQIGAHHLNINIDTAVEAILSGGFVALYLLRAPPS